MKITAQILSIGGRPGAGRTQANVVFDRQREREGGNLLAEYQ